MEKKKLFEGITISYVQNNLDKIEPFIPFAIDNLGGITSLFYCADEFGHGDIIIDCGFTKCFTNMNTSGTYKYFKNIIGWMGKPEFHIEKYDHLLLLILNKNDKCIKFEKYLEPKK